MECTYTIADYLRGKVRGAAPSDEALKSICLNAEVFDINADMSALSERQRRLSEAYLYLWLATSPTSSEKWSEKDGDWSQSGGGEQMSATQVRFYIRLANAILEEYGLKPIGNEKWGMSVGGFRNVRRDQ